MNDLERIQGVKLPQNNTEISAKSIKGVGVLCFPKTKSKKMSYYVAIPGFSVEEFIAYQRLLKDGIAPRPFSTTFSGNIIPFVFDPSYTKKEVEEGRFKELYASGMSLYDIGEEFGIHAQSTIPAHRRTSNLLVMHQLRRN